MNLEILPLAERDIHEAAKYYDTQRAGLGDEFLAEVDHGVSEIVADPLRFELVRNGIRRYLVHRFPYGIYYRLLSVGVVQIVVVKHHRRRTGIGMRRR
jgi:toxin ParE1/3/4